MFRKGQQTILEKGGDYTSTPRPRIEPQQKRQKLFYENEPKQRDLIQDIDYKIIKPRPKRRQASRRQTKRRRQIQTTLGRFGFEGAVDKLIIDKDYLMATPDSSLLEILKNLPIERVIEFVNHNEITKDRFKMAMRNSNNTTRVEIIFWAEIYIDENDDDPFPDFEDSVSIFIDVKWDTFEELNQKIYIIKEYFMGSLDLSPYTTNDDSVRWGYGVLDYDEPYPKDVEFGELFTESLGLYFNANYNYTDEFRNQSEDVETFVKSVVKNYLVKDISIALKDLERHATWEYTDDLDYKALENELAYIVSEKGQLRIKQIKAFSEIKLPNELHNLIFENIPTPEGRFY